MITESHNVYAPCLDMIDEILADYKSEGKSVAGIKLDSVTMDNIRRVQNKANAIAGEAGKTEVRHAGFTLEEDLGAAPGVVVFTLNDGE